jgi:hypothetical protein
MLPLFFAQELIRKEKKIKKKKITHISRLPVSIFSSLLCYNKRNKANYLAMHI